MCPVHRNQCLRERHRAVPQGWAITMYLGASGLGRGTISGSRPALPGHNTPCLADREGMHLFTHLQSFFLSRMDCLSNSY